MPFTVMKKVTCKHLRVLYAGIKTDLWASVKKKKGQQGLKEKNRTNILKVTRK